MKNKIKEETKEDYFYILEGNSQFKETLNEGGVWTHPDALQMIKQKSKDGKVIKKICLAWLKKTKNKEGKK